MSTPMRSEREDAVLFSFSDLPSMVALGLYREESVRRE